MVASLLAVIFLHMHLQHDFSFAKGVAKNV